MWTDWKSASNASDGNDFEILADHVRLFGSVHFLITQVPNFWNKANLNFNFRVCSSPTHIDARTVNGNFSWLGTQTVFIYDTNPKSINSNSKQSERSWAYGISKDSGYYNNLIVWAELINFKFHLSQKITRQKRKLSGFRNSLLLPYRFEPNKFWRRLTDLLGKGFWLWCLWRRKIKY